MAAPSEIVDVDAANAPTPTPPPPLPPQDPKSNVAKTMRKRKKVPSLLQNLKSAEEKQAHIETFEKELDALFRYYKEATAQKVRVELSQCGGSRNVVVAALMEGSDLPLSKLVDEIHDKLNGEVSNGTIVLAEPVTLATVKSSALLVGQRVSYGVPNADADVLEDHAESCLWCWETRDLKLMPKSVRGELSVRRTCRRRIHDRIMAISEVITALRKQESEPDYNHGLNKALTKLNKAFPEAHIRLLVDGLLQKNSEDMDKKRASQEKKLQIKQLERKRKEAKKEKEKESMHNELQKETLLNESDLKLSQDESRNDEKSSQKKKQQKKQVNEAEKNQRRTEKAEAELKRRRSLQKQASFTESFLKRSKTIPSSRSSEKDTVLTKSNASYRPAFYGVRRAKSRVVGPRHRLRKDRSLDYDVSSDEEWKEANTPNGVPMHRRNSPRNPSSLMSFKEVVVSQAKEISHTTLLMLLFLLGSSIKIIANELTSQFLLKLGNSSGATQALSLGETFQEFRTEIAYEVAIMLLFLLALLVSCVRPLHVVVMVTITFVGLFLYIPYLIDKAPGTVVTCGFFRLPLICFTTLVALGLSVIVFCLVYCSLLLLSMDVHVVQGDQQGENLRLTWKWKIYWWMWKRG